MFQNRALRKIFGPKRNEVTVECRRLHNKELYGLSQNIIQVIKSRKRSGWGMWHIRETGEIHTGFWWGGLWERDQWSMFRNARLHRAQ